ncbi:MAG: energy transducer TonB [Thermoanaerobaculia bacterium]
MFESSLIDLEAKKQPKRRRWLSLPLAIFLHVVGLTAFAFASYWSVGAVQEPPTIEAFIDVVLPPPMIQQGGGVRPPKPPETKPEVKPPAPETPMQPDLEHMPDKPRDTTPQQTIEDSGPTLPGAGPTTPPGPGDPNGDRNSRNEIGSTNGKPEVDVPNSGDDLPVHLTAEMSRPVPLHPILPRYTEPARRAGMQGTVIVEAIIDERGNATNVRVLRGLPMGLDRAAVEAIQQTQFKPAMMGSRPVKVYYTLTVTFTIQR